jgi:hypothetical protein
LSPLRLWYFGRSITLLLSGASWRIAKSTTSTSNSAASRAANAIFNLADFYKEATEEDIKAILAHEKLAPVSVDALAKGASQWFCKRFALLKDSEILDQYTVTQIIQHSNGYDLDIQIDLTSGQERIVFPADKAPAKKLLQFLNEELFRGSITERLFETNSKRIAD